jgi:hypothetical protein
MLQKLINYVVGAPKGENKGIPVEVKLSLDPDFKRTLVKSVIIASTGIALGIGAGIVISDMNKKTVRRRRIR